MARLPIALCSVSMLALMLGATAHAQTSPAPQMAAEDDTADIVVTGVRASIVGALNVRKNSTQIVDSIVSEDVGKLPDNNVVEALQRVTGIQVTDRAGGETAGITIRGLTDPLTTLKSTATSSPPLAHPSRCRIFPRTWSAGSTSTRPAR